MFCPKCGCHPPPHTASPPVHPVLTLYWSVGLSLFQGSGLFFRSQLRGVTGTDISACKEWGRDPPPHCSPPAPTPPPPVLPEAFPNWARPVLSREGLWEASGAVGWGPWREQLVLPPLLPSPPSSGAGQEQNFPSGKMFVSVSGDGGGAVQQTQPPWSCLMALMCLGNGGAVIPPQTPPHCQGVWIC